MRKWKSWKYYWDTNLITRGDVDGLEYYRPEINWCLDSSSISRTQNDRRSAWKKYRQEVEIKVAERTIEALGGDK